MKPDLNKWIAKHLAPIKGFNYCNSSYGLKHRAELDLGRYVSEQELTDAMKKKGFKALRHGKGNKHYFNVSKASINTIYKRQSKTRA